MQKSHDKSELHNAKATVRSLTGLGMTKPENRFIVRYKLLETTAAASRFGVMATHMTP